MPEIILFNKPYGVVSQFSGDEPEHTLASFINKPDFYAAGRLDKNSEGLLLLSNNGSLQHRLTHPKFNKRKYYWVQVEGIPSEADLEPLEKGLVLKDYAFLPAEVRFIDEPKIWPRTPPIRFRKNIPTCWLEIVLKEGKNHQVRKMTAAIGYPTLRLIRHRISDWKLGNLQPGEYRIIHHPFNPR
ncbi:pseudouridine synthase [Fluoribacter dumoffii]|uniref:Pseudouridine synthase n=1 Tax=Fluoribacter dumoffii TaxID=463 RepID=A0A377GAX4_9GAMM|nr:pseudouridine synthase [Fluoribacter dumoffii]KTC88638.1 23S rRNA pseudouridine synthase [Fluoribacter dumoffii NY 23]MCW8386070.1 pseudouridine synthase [Fluoribacter dumoffii]MCW8495635.1 pseudouridine synthase [Fluoribacter dumoffii]STO21874.1 Ribosomal large subunit pseudouridine synthase E [Fluoribacter dumoffii]